ncbi:sigma-54-dependent Fis family transcriptional regulator [Oceanimonas baumannii]|uniref:Transcriptional regulator n=1 Tax=Oceanimonas baumannii TaxID=129578 RepID=A0A235CA68_9GAMM|nr:sigma-54-dependent Fis family transcriptional regulator [Oceanimonas baumannii]MCC4262986.1 sigma-54-dependent Fis family transcriptional regulator [Oceanimonas baumannii]OYD21306.1 transcriptional regulator [Oceanimonas baumannii]TDW55809.1 transcriptional regulator of acetoin/glycerol metabolism [Oceanimonas baumannii]
MTMQFLTSGVQPGELLTRSWQRSQSFGLQPHHQADPDCLSPADLRRQQQRHHHLLSLLEKAMPLFEQWQQGRHCRLLFADADGTILLSTGDNRFGDRARRLALATGARWHEQSMGTNAIGTALSEQQEVSILGEQHYIHANRAISCSASPVFSPVGELLGVIDISSEAGAHSNDMLMTARLMALTMENALVSEQRDACWLLNLANDAAGLQQPWSALIALREDGRLLGANRRARQWLPKLDPSALLEQLRQGELTPWGDGMALLSRRCTPARPARPVAQSASDTAPLKLLNHGVPLLLQGETGTGKDHLVRRLHRQSQRAQGPLIAVNCGALPAELIEAELFGHASGAFTGSHKEGRTGYIRAAHNGILFLDEIGELPLASQTRLLRVLQEKAVVPLGCHQPVPVDFCVIAASHRDLSAMVAEGTFREDLYFRLNGYKQTLMPLREYERPAFESLTGQLLQELHGEQARLASGLMEQLFACPWPGNIRQLRQVLEVAGILADGGLIETHHLPELPAAPLTAKQDADLKTATEQRIKEVLDDCNGNVSKAARRLNISRTTLYARLKGR